MAFADGTGTSDAGSQALTEGAAARGGGTYASVGEDEFLVSVVVPTYDRPEMLADALESVVDQRYEPVELVVVDDGSPTPMEPVVAEAAPPDLAWRCLRHDDNRGANAARNTGIEAADGDVLAFLDDDDRWHPEKLPAQVDALREAGDDVGVVLTGQQVVDGDETTVTRLPDVGEDATTDLLTDGVGGPFSTIVVRRSVVDRAGLPDERLPAWQDREWLIRLSCHSDFASVQRPLVVRRNGEYSQISDLFEEKRDVTYPLLLEKHSDLAADLGIERRFKACLSRKVAVAGLTNGYYRDARRFAARALRTDPRLRTTYIYLALALGGRITYGTAVHLRRALG